VPRPLSPAYITTPIYYVNDVPHVGHAYTTIAADVVTRARKLRGIDAFMLTGTDEHGQNIERVARERGVSEQQHSDEIAARFKALWTRYDIAYDGFIRTTDDLHRRGVLKLWGQLVAAKAPDGQQAIYTAMYAGWYCSRCEAFYDEEELKQPGNVCPDHELPVEWTEEENYFFRLSAYSAWLRDEIVSGRIVVEPQVRKNEVVSFIDQGLRDFSASRARVKWGIPVPGQPDHVLYVWIDALSNYITALGFADDAPLYERYWNGNGERMHLVGKDIIRFHCLYWPAILHAAGVKPPNRIFVQGHITKNGKRLSKTTGNVIDPDALVTQYGPDAVRYFLMREGVYGHDWDFTDQAFITRFNADLANDIGNLVSRVVTMAHRFGAGAVPAKGAGNASLDAEAILDRYEALDFSGALSDIWAAISKLNLRIVESEPWAMAKDAARRGDLDALLYELLEGVRQVALLVSPVMPRASERILATLGPATPRTLAWGGLVAGAALGEVQPLFPRLEKRTEAAPPAAAAVAAAPAATVAAATDARIDITDFTKVDLRVAKILAAEKIAGSKKLLRLQVDLGNEQRQIVAGIAEAYEAEALVGRTIMVVANLKPAKLMGVESNGMVLAASVDGKAILCGFDKDVAPGTKVK
jgi:methionyl-tRNA synthetase